MGLIGSSGGVWLVPNQSIRNGPIHLIRLGSSQSKSYRKLYLGNCVFCVGLKT